ncbi:MAG: disulfide bond formation protein B [Erythrobacter sp.]
MSPFDPDFLVKNRIALAILAIVVSAATWASDIGGLVYACPYCRVQRTAIGLIGIILLLPFFHHWIMRMIGSTIGVYGLVVAGTQHFNNFLKMHMGTFEWGERWFIHPWLLSGFALFIITALLMILWSPPQRSGLGRDRR